MCFYKFDNIPENIVSYMSNSSDNYVKSFLFCKGEEQTELPQEALPEVKDLSPVLFADSPNSLPCLLGSAGGVSAFEVFGTTVEEAVREMRFRIEQKTMLTASAGEGKTTVMQLLNDDVIMI